jgi:hypothetical protein
MKSRSWMIPTLPIAAIVAGLGIVWGALAGWRFASRELWRFKHREEIKGVADIHDIFEKVLPLNEWIAAELPVGPPDQVFSLRNTILPKDADSFTAMRAFGTSQGVYGSADLMVATPAEAARAFNGIGISGVYAVFRNNGISLVAKERNREGRGWYVLARAEGGDGPEHLFGLCFYDAVWIQADISGPGATKYADSLARLMKDTAGRLTSASENELRPYTDRFAAEARRRR